MLWAASFRRDYHVYVLAPVQRMVAILSEMTSNPRLAIARGGNQAEENEDDEGEGGGGGGGGGGMKKPRSEMELIEACIGKFGMLLKVGFGEAGMDIIAKNMMGSKGTFNPVVRGSKVWVSEKKFFKKNLFKTFLFFVSLILYMLPFLFSTFDQTFEPNF